MTFWRPKHRGNREAALEIAGRSVPLSVRTNPRARRLIVKVEPSDGRVVVVAPNERSVQAALRFAHTQRDWIAARLAEVAPPLPFEVGSIFPLRDEPCLIEHHPTARRGVWLERDLAGPRLCVSGEAPHIGRRVTHYLKSEARKDLRARVEAHTAHLRVGTPRMSVRDTATRWGSCSSRSGLSFSWRLIFAPPFVLDYVAAHEVAHLKHMDHSPAFWRLVHTLVGDPADANRWLQTEGRHLHRFGRAQFTDD